MYINNCNNNGNSNEFIEFMLKMIDETLDKLLKDSQDINLSKKFGKNLYELNNTERLVLDFIIQKELVSTSEIAKYIKRTDRTALARSAACPPPAFGMRPPGTRWP